MFLGLIIGFGVGVVGFTHLLDRRLPEAKDREQVGWLIVICLGIIPLFLSALFFTSESFCGCEPAYGIGASLLIMIVATIVYHASNAGSRIPTWGRQLATIAGYSSLTAAVLFGITRAVDNLQRLF